MKLSTTMTGKEAVEAIGNMNGLEEISAFIKGENRKTVISAAEERLKALTPSSKEGEVKGPITRDAGDFKEGVQKTKSYVTCEDVIKKMRAEGKKI